MIVVENTTFNLVTEFSAPPPIEITLGAAPVLDFTLSAPGTIQFNFVPQPIINVEMGAPAVGIPGPKGEQGVRGSLLLGAYATEANLPPPSNFLPGDYAIDLEGNFYQIEEI
jgi:hypothetical protein